MSKDMKSVDEMVDYVGQLRLHAKDRLAIHLKVSLLERHFRDEHYRRFIAMTLRPLITKYDGAMFALPTNDIVLIVKDAKPDHIDPLLHHIRRKFRDSALVQGLDPVQGVSDAFVEWFDLGDDYAGFKKYTGTLAKTIVEAIKKAPKTRTATLKKETSRPLKVKAPAPESFSSKPQRRMKMVPITPPAKEKINARQLDPELIVALDKALFPADVTNMLRRQQVSAIIGAGPAEPVMEHFFIPVSVALGKLLLAQVHSQDRWLEGYLAELLARRLLHSLPNLDNRSAIASSLRVSCAAIEGKGFAQLDKSLGATPRSAIILELSAADVVTNFGDYVRAHAKVDPMGYRIMIGEIDLRALLWLDYQSFEADFVKLKLPADHVDDWLNPALEKALRNQIIKIGIARVILDGCETKADIEVGQRLGITLFQGDAVSPITS